MSLLPAVFLPLASVDAMADDSIFSFRVESGMAFMGHVVWRLYIYIRRGAGSEAYILGICGNGAFSIYFFAI